MSLKSVFLAACMSLAAFTAPSRADLSCTYALQNWSNNGILDGTTSITPPTGPSATAQFHYDVDLGNPGFGVPFRTTDFSVVANASGDVTFHWAYSGYHAFCCPDPMRAVLQVYVQTNSGEQVTSLVESDTFGGFSFSGDATVSVEAGQRWGLRVGGHNFDSDSRLFGTVELSNFAAPQLFGAYAMENWASSGITDGTTSITPPAGAASAATFGYNVSLGDPGPGVSFRTADFFVPAETNEQITFDWTYSGFHAFFLTQAHLQTYVTSCGTRLSQTLVDSPTSDSFTFSGSATIQVRRGEAWGFTAGGSNFDSNSTLIGNVTIRNVCRTPVACVADVDGGAGDGLPDGGVTIDDLLYYLFVFESGHLCADVDDGSSTGTPDAGVTIDDLLYFLQRFESGC